VKLYSGAEKSHPNILTIGTVLGWWAGSKGIQSKRLLIRKGFIRYPLSSSKKERTISKRREEGIGAKRARKGEGIFVYGKGEWKYGD